jgi:hypothetical protein
VEVLLQAQAEFVDYQGNGASFMELSHRDANGPVQNIVEAASQNLRDLLRVPDSHTILFFQGGAHAQVCFMLVPEAPFRCYIYRLPVWSLQYRFFLTACFVLVCCNSVEFAWGYLMLFSRVYSDWVLE